MSGEKQEILMKYNHLCVLVAKWTEIVVNEKAARARNRNEPLDDFVTDPSSASSILAKYQNRRDEMFKKIEND